MPSIFAIQTIDDLRLRASTAAQQAAEVLRLAELPFGGIEPWNVMAEFNEILSASLRLLGSEQCSEFHAYSTLHRHRQAGSPYCRSIIRRQAAIALRRLASHVETQASMPAVAVDERPSSI